MGILNIFKKEYAQETKKNKLSNKENNNQEQQDKIFRDTFINWLAGETNITEKEAMRIPAYSSCANFISGIIASMTIKLYEKNNESNDVEEIRGDKRVYLLNSDSGDLLSPFEMKKAFILDFLNCAEGYIYIERKLNEVKSLRFVDSKKISKLCNNSAIFKNVYYKVDGLDFDEYDFIRMLRNTKDGVNGESLVSENTDSLNTARLNSIFERKLATSGGAKNILVFPKDSTGQLGKKEADLFTEGLKHIYTGTNSSQYINVPIDVFDLSKSAAELQLKENKEINNKDISKTFCFADEIFSEECTDELFINTIKTSCFVIIKQFEGALNRALLLEEEKGKKYFSIDLDEVLKVDILKRFQAYEIGLGKNILQPDEVRIKENLPALGLNFIKLGQSDVIYYPETGQFISLNSGKKLDDTKSDEGETNG